MATYINDNGEYYNGHSLVYDGKLFISPSEEIILAAGYHLVVPPTPDPLEVAKAAKISEIEDYDMSSEVNLFYLSDQPMWLDAQTRQTLRISIESYVAMNVANVTKWFGGQQFTFSTTAWLQMLNALEVYAAEALNVTESHKAAVLAMNNVADIEAYDITAGYPQKLNLSAAWLLSQS